MDVISYKTGSKLTPPPPGISNFPPWWGYRFSRKLHTLLYILEPKITCYLQRGLHKLYNAAQTMIMLWRLPIREMGSSFLIIRNVFSRKMACSTKMRRLAIVLVFCTSAFLNCSCPRFSGGIKRSALWSKRSSTIGHYYIIWCSEFFSSVGNGNNLKGGWQSQMLETLLQPWSWQVVAAHFSSLCPLLGQPRTTQFRWVNPMDKVSTLKQKKYDISLSIK